MLALFSGEGHVRRAHAITIDADPQGLVRLGNERVLRARFNDARFFWNFDLQRPLDERIADLKSGE